MLSLIELVSFIRHQLLQKIDKTPCNESASGEKEEGTGQDVEGQHKICIRQWYCKLLSSLTKIPEIIDDLYEKEMLCDSELQQIRQFQENPIRATEELLSILVKSSKDVFECFLESLKTTRQEYIHEWLTSSTDQSGTAQSSKEMTTQKEVDEVDSCLIGIDSHFDESVEQKSSTHETSVIKSVGKDIKNFESVDQAQIKFGKSAIILWKKFHLLEHDLLMEISIKMTKLRTISVCSIDDILNEIIRNMNIEYEKDRKAWNNEKRELQQEHQNQRTSWINELEKLQQEYVQELETMKSEEKNRREETVAYSHPVLINCVGLRKSGNEYETEAQGMAILSDEIYIIYEASSEMDVFDSNTCMQTSRKLVKTMDNPKDIAACLVNRCLYVLDGGEYKMQVLRIDARKGEIIAKWDLNSKPVWISVSDGRVVLSILSGGMREILEYNSDGFLVDQTCIDEIRGEHSLWQALRTNLDCFVCISCSYPDDQAELAIADHKGHVVYRFPMGKCSYRGFSYSMVRDKSGNILVADPEHSRILLFDPTLKTEHELIAKQNGLKNPKRILIQESKGWLFVMTTGEILQVFKLQQNDAKLNQK